MAWQTEVWQKLHIEIPKLIGCPNCRNEYTEFISFFHDYVNLKIGKKLHNPQNFKNVARKLCKLNNICKGRRCSKLY